MWKTFLVFGMAFIPQNGGLVYTCPWLAQNLHLISYLGRSFCRLDSEILSRAYLVAIASDACAYLLHVFMFFSFELPFLEPTLKHSLWALEWGVRYFRVHIVESTHAFQSVLRLLLLSY